MRYIEAPQSYTGGELCLFLAGGITGCPDWQREIVTALASTSLVLFNPRRAAFPIDIPHAAREQISWEHQALRTASAILFWFPKETLCPIVLYELGAWSMTHKRLFVGIHPEYQRKQDVLIQTSLVRPDITPVFTLEELVQDITQWMAYYGNSRKPGKEEYDHERP
jgi:hypothetical protein